jgi:hypothetical protein
MDMRHVFAALAGVFCIFLIFATVTPYRTFRTGRLRQFLKPAEEKPMGRTVLLAFLAASSCLIVHATEVRATTAEVARKCQALTTAKFPPRVPGNPAAGSAKGSGLEQQDYFKACVANGGQPPERDQQKNSK